MLKKRFAKISTKQGVARRRDGSPVQAGEAPGAQSLGRFLWTAKDDPSGAKKRQINLDNQHVQFAVPTGKPDWSESVPAFWLPFNEALLSRPL